MKHISPISKTPVRIAQAQLGIFYPLGIVLALIQNLLVMFTARLKVQSSSIPSGG